MHANDLIDRIEALFQRHGEQLYEGARQESVSALEHALQCAQLAEWAGADLPLVAAALLHDIGHFLVIDLPDSVDDAHEDIAGPFLAQAFGPAVVEPVRLHVQAKRYLVSADPAYRAGLSPASVHSLALQGGPFDTAQGATFLTLPFAMDAVQLRRWDDLAKSPNHRTPPLGYYQAMLEELSLATVHGQRDDVC
jgi:phosphonate degradation associated HDIG domain protein